MISDTLLWMSDNLPLWRDPAVMLLACVVLGLLSIAAGGDQ